MLIDFSVHRNMIEIDVEHLNFYAFLLQKMDHLVLGKI